VRAALFGSALPFAFPAVASAHGIAAKADLPIPAWLFAWAATLVLLVSFGGLAVLWRSPRLAGSGTRDWVGMGAWADVLLGAIGVVWFSLVCWAGLTGTFVSTANLAPTAVWVLFWVGMPIVNAIFGDVFRLLNPWRAVGRLCGWLMAKLVSDGVPTPNQWPSWLGRLPAALGLLAIGWVELAYTGRDDPSILAALALGYVAVQLVGMSAFGVEVWSDRADSFGVAFSLIARIAPFERTDGRLRLRAPLAGLVRMPSVAWTQLVLLVMIGVTSFDGFTQGPLWSDLSQTLSVKAKALGFAPTGAAEAASTVGIALALVVVCGIWSAGVWGASKELKRPAREVARTFTHILVPIALAYTVAHYASLLLIQGQALGYLISDPTGSGTDWFGTAQWSIDYGLISPTGVWWLQVGALLVGHIAALVLAHDRALEVAADSRTATRSQIPMLIATVAFTTLGLWLLSAGSL